MDLRPYKLNAKQIARAKALIRDGLLRYQPFIFTDTLEVGEGQNLHDRYPDGLFVSQVYCEEDLGIERAQTQNLEHFRYCNAGYRRFYDHFADFIADQFGGEFSELAFSEIGCNSGLHLFNLAVRGARSCTGYDWTDMTPAFNFLNEALNTRVKFKSALWNRHQHRIDGASVPEVDVMLSSVFINHQFDPLQHIAYICDRSRKAVFLWILIDTPKTGNPYVVSYSPSLELSRNPKDRQPFPNFLNNGVTISEPLLKTILERLGFGKIIDIPVPDLDDDWQRFCVGFRPYLAIRTTEMKSTFF
ncbi:MAG: hypothetical protein ACYC1L_09720 [Alphaproteobacteria bacterium]